ncbi:MAG TPA: CBS domain-containing protein [Candidatus Binatia bacterium]
MRVRDVMEKDVLTLGADDTLDLLDDMMRLAHVRHIPIVSGGALVGIVSQRDLFRAAISSVLQLRNSVEREWLAKIPIREIMTTSTLTIDPDASIHEAVDVMVGKRIGCLPVVASGRLVGLLSESDCLRYLAHLLGLAEVKATLPEMPGD